MSDLRLPIRMNLRGPPDEETLKNMHTESAEWIDDPDESNWRVYWTEPDISNITTEMASVLPRIGLSFPPNIIQVDLWAEGAFNKVYTVQCRKDETSEIYRCILRIASPVCPYYKVESEVATLQFLQFETGVPVPDVYAFDSSMNNRIGVEWILMQHMPGTPYDTRMHDLDGHTNEQILHHISEWRAQIAKKSWNHIGSLYSDWEYLSPGSKAAPNFYIGRAVYDKMVIEAVFLNASDRGPYATMRSYFSAYLDAKTKEMEKLVEEEVAEEAKAKRARDRKREKSGSGDESSDSEDYEITMLERVQADLDVCQNLNRVVKQSAMLSHEPLTTHLYHHDLHAGNILIGDDNLISGILDWEMIVSLPPVLHKQYKFVGAIENVSDAAKDALIPPVQYGPEISDKFGVPAAVRAQAVKNLAKVVFTVDMDPDEALRITNEFEQTFGTS
jgi:hypothetical protein